MCCRVRISITCSTKHLETDVLLLCMKILMFNICATRMGVEMVLFDLANRFPAMGVQLKKLMRDEASVVIPPFLVLARSRGQAARANFCLGVMPPRAMFGRS